MKKLIIGILVLAFIGMIVGTILNYRSYMDLPDYDFNEEIIDTIEMGEKHCVDKVCINNLHIVKTTDNFYGTEYSIKYDVENYGDTVIDNFKATFVFVDGREKIEVKQDEALSLEPSIFNTTEIDDVDKILDNVTDYTFTY